MRYKVQMDLPQDAAENLGIIRRLMERATVYRALSAPTALAAGFLALAVAAGQIVFHRPPDATGIVGGTPREQSAAFILPWLLTLAAVGVVNGWFLARDARQRSEPFFSSGMRLAFGQMLPPLLAGAVFTVSDLAWGRDPLTTVGIWLLFYGLALLSTSVFAPRSLVGLGMAFLGAALGFATIRLLGFAFAPMFPNFVWAAWVMMGTFGLFHLVYAAFAWRDATAPAVEIT